MEFMTFSPGNVLALCVFAMAVIWLVLVRNLFRSLSARHPQKYEELGRPSLTNNNNLRTNMRFLKFLFGSESSSLNDLSLSKRLSFMRIWLIVFFVAFVVLLSVGTQQ
jgi:cellulose synthase/poly-beta-1,6-N-acetylglucosamine synthase-like glycosyltransferase